MLDSTKNGWPCGVTATETSAETVLLSQAGYFLDKIYIRESLLEPNGTGEGMGKVLGYGRVSTDEQDVDSQKMAMLSIGAVVVFTDVGSGSSLTGRDQLEAAIRLLDAGDTLLCLHPDRLARDTGDLLTIAKRVVAKGAILRINDPQIIYNGSDIMGEVMLTIFGMVGMVEKHFIKARQRRGIEAAKARGDVYKGRPPSIRPEDVQELRSQGLGATEIAKRLNIARASVYRALAAKGNITRHLDTGYTRRPHSAL